MFQCSYHAWACGCGALISKCQTCFFHCFRSIVSKCTDHGSVLFKLRKIIKQTFYSTGCKKQITSYSFLASTSFTSLLCVRYIKASSKFAIICFQPVHDLIILLVFRTYIQEFFILFMFVDHIKHAFIGAIGTIKHLSFPVQNEFLKIERHCFSNAEIFGILRNTDFHFFAGAEKMIDSIAAGENYPGIILNLNLLFAEILCRNSFQTNKRMKIQFHVIFPCKLKVRRLITFGPRLGNQNLFYCFGLIIGLVNPVFYHVRFG